MILNPEPRPKRSCLGICEFGFAGDVRASSDVYKVTIDYVDHSTSSYKLDGVNSTYDTINTLLYGFELTPDGSRDYRIQGKILKNH